MRPAPYLRSAPTPCEGERRADGGGTWLLAQAPPELIDALVAIGIADEDLEPDDPMEDGDPGEPDYRR